MGSRSTFVRRIEQLESAVIGFGRGVAQRRSGARAAHHHAIDLAVDALVGSLLAEPDDIRRIRAVQDVDFHVRHIDRLLDALALDPGPWPQLAETLACLDLALTAVEARDATRLDRLDRAVERILDGAERPLLRDGSAASAPDARLRRVALHVLAIADLARCLVPSARARPVAPVA